MSPGDKQMERERDRGTDPIVIVGAGETAELLADQI
jgi:hypothetical protein